MTSDTGALEQLIAELCRTDPTVGRAFDDAVDLWLSTRRTRDAAKAEQLSAALMRLYDLAEQATGRPMLGLVDVVGTVVDIRLRQRVD